MKKIKTAQFLGEKLSLPTHGDPHDEVIDVGEVPSQSGHTDGGHADPVSLSLDEQPESPGHDDPMGDDDSDLDISLELHPDEQIGDGDGQLPLDINVNGEQLDLGALDQQEPPAVGHEEHLNDHGLDTGHTDQFDEMSFDGNLDGELNLEDDHALEADGGLGDLLNLEDGDNSHPQPHQHPTV